MNPRPPPCEGDALPAELLPHHWRKSMNKIEKDVKRNQKDIVFSICYQRFLSEMPLKMAVALADARADARAVSKRENRAFPAKRRQRYD